MKVTNRTFDVVIVGGGLLGLTAALAFSKLPLKVGLISAQSLDKLSIDHLDLRVSAIHQGSEAFLKKLNIFQQLPADRMGVFERIFVWEEMGKEHIDFSAHENRQEVLGHIIENNVMQFELYRALKASAVSLQEATCTEIEPIAYGWKVQLSQGEAWETQLLVGADGAHSFVRQAAGMSTKPVVYGQDAIIATVNVQHPHANTAYQRFLKTGPLAFLPLTLPHQCSIVWTLPTLEADQKMALSEKDFNEAMTQALAEKLGQVSLASKRLKFPLMHHHASTYVAPGLALVGDAAHVIHPLAGLGANLGFADVEALKLLS
ncbi:MAG: hypothetical protein EBX40_02620 [Gammaproteobacteria bacterium]|nr:hypothetical protein [Gammaproteobacteria bacterium]